MSRSEIGWSPDWCAKRDARWERPRDSELSHRLLRSAIRVTTISSQKKQHPAIVKILVRSSRMSMYILHMTSL